MHEFLKEEAKYLIEYFNKKYGVNYNINDLKSLGIHWMYRDVIDKNSDLKKKVKGGKQQ